MTHDHDETAMITGILAGVKARIAELLATKPEGYQSAVTRREALAKDIEARIKKLSKP